MEMLSVGSFLSLVFLTAAKCLIADKVNSRAMRTDGNVYMKRLKCSFSRFKDLFSQN